MQRSSATFGDEDEERTTVDRRFRSFSSDGEKTELVDPAAFQNEGPRSREKSVPPSRAPFRSEDEAGDGSESPVRRYAVASAKIGWSRVIASLVTLISIGSFFFAYREHENARALRATLEEIHAAHAIPRSTGSSDPTVPRPVTRPELSDGTELGAEFREESRTVLERRGADLLGANDYASALTHYRAMVALFPKELVFQHIVRILESKKRCGESGVACP